MDAFYLLDLCILRYCDNHGLIFIPYFIRNYIKDFLSERAVLRENRSVLREISGFTKETDAFWYWSARKLDLSHLTFPPRFIKPTMTQGLLEALKSGVSLNELDLTQNNVGDDCVKAIGEVLHRHLGLMTLVFEDMKLCDIGALAVAQFLTTNRSITSLNLNFNGITNIGAKAIAGALSSNSCLKELLIGKNRIGDIGAIEFAAVLKSNTTLKLLNLPAKSRILGLDENSNDMISARGAVAMAEALEVNRGLTFLNLASQHIGDEGMTAIANSLRVNSTLIHLCIASNSIETNLLTDDSVVILADALKSNSSLQILDLSENSIGYFGALALAELLHITTSLIGLYLGNGTRGFDLDNSSRSWYRNKKWFECNNAGNEGVAALSAALLVNTTLQILDLSQNEIGDEGAESIAGALHGNLSITHLDISMNSIGDEGALALATAFAANRTFSLNVQHNDFSVHGRTTLEDAWFAHGDTSLSI